MKIVLLPLKAYLNISADRMYRAFIKDLKINKFALFYQRFELPWYFGKAFDLIRGISLPTLFDQFDTGLITPDQFRLELRNKFSSLANKSDLEIDKAWNKLYLVGEKACQAFKEAKQLHNNETLFVTFYGDTNILHHRSIKEQYDLVSGQINLIPGKLFLSYLEGVKGFQLIEKYTQKNPAPEKDKNKEKRKFLKLTEESPRALPHETLLIYTPPPAMPYPKLGRLCWVFAPRKSWLAYKEQAYYHDLVSLAKKNNFTLVPSQATINDPNIIQSLDTLVDISTKPVHKMSLDLNYLQPETYTPRHLAVNLYPTENSRKLSPPRSPSTPTGTTKFTKFRISS